MYDEVTLYFVETKDRNRKIYNRGIYCEWAAGHSRIKSLNVLSCSQFRKIILGVLWDFSDAAPREATWKNSSRLFLRYPHI